MDKSGVQDCMDKSIMEGQSCWESKSCVPLGGAAGTVDTAVLLGVWIVEEEDPYLDIGISRLPVGAKEDTRVSVAVC